MAASSGMESAQLDEIIDKVPGIEYICLDVANGYTEAFVQHVEEMRAKYPKKTIIVCILV